MSAIRKVERYQSSGNVRGLGRLLRRGDPLVRRRAAQALGELRRPESVPYLARALKKDSDQYVQRWVIEALQKVATPEAIDVLIEAMFSLRVQVARLAEQALALVPARQAVETFRLKEILTRNDWPALGSVGPEAKRALAVIMASEQYASWPSAKAQRILRTAVELGITPPARYSRELANMGLYVSGVHTYDDLLRGLRNPSPNVRMAAAERLGESGQTARWVLWMLYRRFRREAGPGGDRRVAAALARALDRLGDGRAIEQCRETLTAAGGQPATEAAYLLAAIGTPTAVKELFWFAAEPLPPPAYRNVPLAMSALDSAGDAAVDVLRPYTQHEDKGVRRLVVDVIARSTHADRLDLLGELSVDDDPDIQRAAIDALGATDTAEAARKLHSLAGSVPQEWLLRSLAGMTHPTGPAYLRDLAPHVTTVTGILREEGRGPITDAQVQIVQELFDEETDRWNWQAASVRTRTDSTGAFALAVVDWPAKARLRLKVVILPPSETARQETFLADLPLEAGEANRVEAWIDRLFDRLVVTVGPAVK